MPDQDDLFEFGDFEDDSLELNLDDLFGDLEVLAIDTESVGVVPVDAPAEPTVQPVQPGKPAAPAPTPVAAEPQPAPAAAPAAAAQLPPVQPQVAAAPAPTAKSNTARLQLVTISIAAIVTIANFAVMALPKASQPDPEQATTQVQAEPTEPQSEGATDAVDAALLARITQLETQLNAQSGIPDAIPTLPNQRHRAFDEIESQIAAGEYVAARSRLYSLLAVVDRFDAVRANEIEQQASYMLADTYRLEAQAQEHNL